MAMNVLLVGSVLFLSVLSTSSGARTGTVYTVWGKPSCPNSADTEKLYDGFMAGKRYNINGGGSNHLCLPQNPDYSKSYIGASSKVYGTMIHPEGGPFTPINDNILPCAVCYAKGRTAHVMIPAAAACPFSWKTEYFGYIYAEHSGPSDRQPSTYQCIHSLAEAATGVNQIGLSGGNTPAVLLPFAAACHGLPCPPYVETKVLTCVVCTK